MLECLDKVVLEFLDKGVVSCLDEGVVLCLDMKKNMNYFDVDIRRFLDKFFE